MNIQPLLQSYYERSFPDFIHPTITRLSRITRGWESEVYAYDLEHGEPDRRLTQGLILRIYPGKNANDKSASEFEGMRTIHRAGYPVPQAYHLERDASPFGKPFMIMERFEGQLLWELMIGPDQEVRPAYLELFCRLFVQLHNLVWKPFFPQPELLDPGEPFFFVDLLLERYHGISGQYPQFGLNPALEWLQARRDLLSCPRGCPVHQDFHPQNILVKLDENGQVQSAAVIDWTGLAISDPRFDLAWTSVLTYAYVGETARSAVLAGYESASGTSVERIELFEVFACLRRLLSITISIMEGAEKSGMRAGAEQEMREQLVPARRVYDMLHGYTDLKFSLMEDILNENR